MINYNRLGYEIKRDFRCPRREYRGNQKRIFYCGNCRAFSKQKMPLPVYEKVFSAAEKGFISATHENLQCLKSLSAHFSKNCVRTLDRGFDANDYYRYFLKNDEKFVIRSKKNRNVIYNGKTQNIMDVAGNYKGNYRMDFKDKHGKKIECKISYIPVQLCEFPNKTLVLVAVYGFGAQPMLLLTNLDLLKQGQILTLPRKNLHQQPTSA